MTHTHVGRQKFSLVSHYRPILTQSSRYVPDMVFPTEPEASLLFRGYGRIGIYHTSLKRWQGARTPQHLTLENRATSQASSVSLRRTSNTPSAWSPDPLGFFPASWSCLTCWDSIILLISNALHPKSCVPVRHHPFTNMDVCGKGVNLNANQAIFPKMPR